MYVHTTTAAAASAAAAARAGAAAAAAAAAPSKGIINRGSSISNMLFKIRRRQHFELHLKNTNEMQLILLYIIINSKLRCTDTAKQQQKGLLRC